MLWTSRDTGPGTNRRWVNWMNGKPMMDWVDGIRETREEGEADAREETKQDKNKEAVQEPTIAFIRPIMRAP